MIGRSVFISTLLIFFHLRQDLTDAAFGQAEVFEPIYRA
jgi:hypothetical protein